MIDGEPVYVFWRCGTCGLDTVAEQQHQGVIPDKATCRARPGGVCGGTAYRLPEAWSRAIWENTPGIVRHDGPEHVRWDLVDLLARQANTPGSENGFVAKAASIRPLNFKLKEGV